MGLIFNLVLVILLAGIAYIHWVQGLFTSVISMVLAIIAASLAIGYHESVITRLLGGGMADYAHAMLVPTLFALIYIVLRVAFDMLVPGNVRVPHLVDKIGGGLCGLVAGIFCLGTVAIGAQMLPVGPSVVDYSRYELVTKDVGAVINGKGEDLKLYNVLAVEPDKLAAPDSSQQKGLWVPVDSMLASFVAFQSDNGAMAGARSFRAAHPDLLTELFFQRLATPLGVKRVATTFVRPAPDVSVKGSARWLKSLRQSDSMIEGMRGKEGHIKPDPTNALNPPAGQVLLAIPLVPTNDAAEKDGIFRVAPGQIRLVTPKKEDGTPGRNYYPIGTLYRGNVLVREHADDMVYIDVKKMDALKPQDETTMPLFVFLVDGSELFTADAKGNPAKFKPGAFVEVKRLNYIPLADVPVKGPDVAHFPQGDGIASRIPQQPGAVAAANAPQQPSDPVVRRPEVVVELNKLDRGPDPSSLPAPR